MSEALLRVYGRSSNSLPNRAEALASCTGRGSRPRGLLGRPVAAVAIGQVARRRFEQTFREYDLLARGAQDVEARTERPRLAPGARERLKALRAEVERTVTDRALVERLIETVEQDDAVTLARLRPYALADRWRAERRSVLELFLHATKAGLLESRWELLCPHCRGAADSSQALAGLTTSTRCDTCGVDAAADLERSVELVFRPNPAVREVEGRTFCVAGPWVTPHVVAQQSLEAGERRQLQLRLEPGRYRLRALGVTGSTDLAVSAEGPDQISVRVGADGWPAGTLELGQQAALELTNQAEHEVLVSMERTTWSDEAATAADVTALQTFRDLFSTEALRPGTELAISTLTVAFTDLRDSTRLYREIGDAPAFGSVSDHFEVLRRAIATEGGAIVKTIGDAVMAVFRRPVSSARALLRAQGELVSGDDCGRPLFLKVGIHVGPCIAVTLNERLDYFGSTVNAAARLVGHSTGEDVVISDAVRQDREVADLLAELALDVEKLDVELKGFDQERFELWRLRQRLGG